MSKTQSPLIAKLGYETRQHFGLTQEDAAKLKSYQLWSDWRKDELAFTNSLKAKRGNAAHNGNQQD